MSNRSRFRRVLPLAIVVMSFILAACKGGTSGY
jgi:predicted small secreted protein